MIIAPALAVAFYLFACVQAVRGVVPATPRLAAGPAEEIGRGDGGSLPMLLGLLAHAVALHAGLTAGEDFRFGFALALSASFWVGVAILWFEGRSVRIDALRVAVLPVAAAAALLPLAFPGAHFRVDRELPLFLPHLVVGTLAYGVLMLAALHALLMIFATRALHRFSGGDSPLARWVEQLPPLMVMERLLFRFIVVGFLLLTLTALSGIVFSEEVFGRPLRSDHKTIFALVSWALFCLLLVGRRLWGWRGRTALRLTLLGFGVLLLAYVGSRFVLEVILHRI